jgi:glycogen debranching enzyme
MAQTLKGILGWLARYRNSAGLLENVPGWTFLDWTNPAMTGRGRNIKGLSAGLNLFYLQGLTDAAWLAKHALPELQAAKLEQQVARLRQALHKTFWNSACGCYVDSAENGRQSASVSQHINALALLLDVAAPEQRCGILARVWESNMPVHQPSPYFCFYVFRALAKCGRYDLAVKALREKWLPMVMAGNETFWETFQSATKQKGFPESYCQLWSCAPLYDLPAEVLGVKPLQPAFRLFEVCPTPADLQWAQGQVPTPRGLIKIAWQRNGKALRIDLQVPDRCAAVTRNPKGWVEAKTPGSQKHQASPHIFHAGSHRISYRLE